MKANPGGIIDSNCVYGRDHLIKMLWSQLDRQGVLVSAERRIGKTSVLRKMMKEPVDGWLPLFLDLEKFHSAEEFSIGVYEQIQSCLGHRRKVTNLARKFYEDHQFGEFKRTGGSRPWKDLLGASVRDLLSERGKKERVVFFWDEVPYMLDHIRQAKGEQAAVEVLDTLRSLRQEFSELRMLFSGSIGLHHVLNSIRDGKTSSEPVNDMMTVEVPPLELEDAVKLACDLIEGEGLNASDLRQSALAVATEADCFPFYIHHIVAGLRDEGDVAEPSLIRDLVQRQLVDPNGSWQLGHYRDRLQPYYGEHARLVALILDSLAVSSTPLAVRQLQEAINILSSDFDDRDLLLRMLRLMGQDHYLQRAPDGCYSFRFPLIQRWWKLDRGF